MGYIQPLFRLFGPLLKLQPFILKNYCCKFCKFEKTERSRFPVPISINDLNHLSFNSLQEYFNWYFSLMIQMHCEICLQNHLESEIKYENDPNFIIIELISLNGRLNPNFNYGKILTSKNSNYQLFSTLNMPYSDHFTCCIDEPILDSRENNNQWFVHDDLIGNL